MAHPKELQEFGNKVRLFPLPNFVMMPHVMKVFHIFEPRYVQMIEDSLSEDRFVALVLPRPGWEGDYAGTFPISEVACLTRIVHDQRLDDGRFDLILKGVCRIRLGQELLTTKLYRQAEAEPLLDDLNLEIPALRDEMGEVARTWLQGQNQLLTHLNELLQGNHSLAMISDVISFAIPLPPEIKQALLETVDVERRARLLIKALKRFSPEEGELLVEPPSKKRKSPPDFSLN